MSKKAVGVIIGLGTLAGIIALATRKPAAAVPVVWRLGGGLNIHDTGNIKINQPANGNYANLDGYADSFVSFEADRPVLIKEVIVHLVNPYSYVVENFVSLAISLDGITRQDVGPLVHQTPERYWLGSTVATMQVGLPARFIYLYQNTTGVSMGIDAVEIVT